MDIRTRSSGRLRRGIIASGALLIAAFVGSAGYDSWRLHQQIMLANSRELSNLANALAAQASRSIQLVDVLLTETATWYSTTAATLTPEALQQALAQRATSAPEVSIVTVVDAKGMQRLRSRSTAEPLADVSDRDYFKAQRDSTNAGLYINPPLVTRTEGVPALVLSRRLTTRDGAFAGVITALVDLDRLQSMYEAIHPGHHSAMLLTLEDGTLVIRQPPIPGLTTSYPELAALKRGPRLDRTTSPMDGKSKLVVAVGVGQRPLILAITRDEDEALRPWYDEVRSGAIRTVLLSLLVVLTVVALLRQLVRLERGEQALRQSEERYAMAMEAANEGHAEWNITEDTVFISTQWRKLHGVDQREPVLTSSELINRIRVHPEDRGLVTRAVEDHLGGRSDAIELEYRICDAPDHEWRWIHARGRCVRDADGAPRRLFCAAIDVSARKQAETHTAQLQARLQQTQRLEALGTLAGGIAHDFNNILAAILGFGEMAQQGSPTSSSQRRHIDRVLQAGARARLLVKRILTFSRSGVTERAQVNVQALVEEVLVMLTPTLPPAMRVDARLNAEGAFVLGDATQLYQVVMNLCTNAVHAMGESGDLQLRLGHVNVAQSASMLQGDIVPGQYLRLEVVDTGAGIDPEVLPRIFDPFFTTKRGTEGTGLGLSVVHGIVTDMGGAINVDASSTQGTHMSLWLPMSERRRDVASSPVVAEWPKGNGEVVMVVDDEHALVQLVEELLAGLGYEPVGFNSSESALRSFIDDPARFDAVLSDEKLPGMPGSELAARLRQARPELPVLLMSGRVDAALELRARDAGVSAVLHKPLTLRELADGMAALLKPRR